MTPEFIIFVFRNLDLWPWHSNSSERGTKHVFTMWIWRKSVQLFPRYFIHKQNNHRLTAPKTEPSAFHCVR